MIGIPIPFVQAFVVHFRVVSLWALFAVPICINSQIVVPLDVQCLYKRLNVICCCNNRTNLFVRMKIRLIFYARNWPVKWYFFANYRSSCCFQKMKPMIPADTPTAAPNVNLAAVDIFLLFKWIFCCRSYTILWTKNGIPLSTVESVSISFFTGNVFGPIQSSQCEKNSDYIWHFGMLLSFKVVTIRMNIS